MKYLILILLTLSLRICFGQSPTFNPSFSSPNATSLGMFGDIPVSLHNGVPNIGIPLYEINEGPIKVPIALNYHASGVRPDVHPGWVGNGWALSCGGMITRVAKGMPEETIYDIGYNVPNVQGGTFGLSFFLGHMYNNMLQASNWATANRIDTLAKKGTEYQVGNNDPYLDTEIDEFIFNFNGISGKFIFDHNNQLKCISRPDIKIEVDDTLITADYRHSGGYTYAKPAVLAGQTGYISLVDYKIKGFRITMPDGIQYEFGLWNRSDDLTDYPYEYSINCFQQVYAAETWDTWYLRRILAPDGHAVTFVYGTPADGIYSPIAEFGRTFAIEKANGTAPAKGLFKIFGPVSASSTEITEYYTGRIINPTYVTKIQTSTEEIKFTTGITNELKYDWNAIYDSWYQQYDKSYDKTIYDYYRGWYPIDALTPLGQIYPDYSKLKWRQLNEISVFNIANQQKIKSWKLNYSSDSTKRLTLLSLEQKSNGSDSSLKHTFSYNTSKTLPVYNSYKTDHWGFYNGRVPTLYSFTDASLDSFYTKKNTDTSYLYAGILEKINFPTGGYTQLVYEPNQYSKIVKRDSTTGAFSLQTVTPRFAGGLRIKQIVNHAGNGAADVIKNYEYTDGILNGDFQYFWKNYQGRLANGNNYTCDRFITQTMLPVSTNSVGSHVGYSKVKESISGNGYTEYYYTNYDTLDHNFLATIDPQKSRFTAFSDRSIERGLLVKQLNYNQLNILLKEQYITYPLSDTSKYSRSTYTKNFTVLQGLAVEGTSYKVYTYPYKEIQVKTIVHNQADSSKKLITTTDFTYESQYSLLQWEKMLNSKGDTLKTLYKYPFNYSGTAVYDSMVVRSRIAPVIEKSTYKNSNFLQSAKTNYQDWGNNLIEPVTMESKTGSLASEVRQRVYKYDSKGNVLETSKDEDTHITYIWDYNRMYPVAECTNADTASVAYTSFEADGKGGWIFAGTPATDPFAITGNKAYSLNGSNAITRANLVSSKVYIVSYWTKNSSAFSITGTLSGYPIAGKTVNGWKRFEHRITGQTQLSISGSGWIDELCFYPATGQMKTYTYEPLIGISSQTDVSGKIVYYQYDNFSRLILVKDDDNNVLKRICYNYAGQTESCALFGNVQKTGSFTRNNCTGDSTGVVVIDTVAANTYFADTQAIADSLAQADITANGQTKANMKGTCLKLWHNVIKGTIFTRNNCSSGYTGGTVAYSVPAGTYNSTISQAYVDSLAQADVNANGQNYANSNASCAPAMGTVYSYCPFYNYVVKFTNTGTGLLYQYNVTPGNNQVLGGIPTGVYNVQIICLAPPFPPPTRTNQFCSYLRSGLNVTFSNVSVNSSNSSCLVVNIH